ncbi:MAG: hypothetical protein AAFW46_15480 [Pseudomonadota bacterium]
MDYANRRRVTIWGTARVVEDDPALVERLTPEGHRARPAPAILFSVGARDSTCPQRIPKKLGVDEIAGALSRAMAERDAKTAGLEAEIAELRRRG